MKTHNIRPGPTQYHRVGVRADGDRIRLETEDEGCTAIAFLSPEQARKLAENLLKAAAESTRGD